MNNADCLSRRCFKVSNGVVCLSKLNIMEPAVNARIQDMRIVTKVSLSEEEVEFGICFFYCYYVVILLLLFLYPLS